MQELKAIDKRYDQYGEVFLYGTINGWLVLGRNGGNPYPATADVWKKLSLRPVSLFDDLPVKMAA